MPARVTSAPALAAKHQDVRLCPALRRQGGVPRDGGARRSVAQVRGAQTADIRGLRCSPLLRTGVAAAPSCARGRQLGPAARKSALWHVTTDILGRQCPCHMRQGAAPRPAPKTPKTLTQASPTRDSTTLSRPRKPSRGGERPAHPPQVTGLSPARRARRAPAASLQRRRGGVLVQREHRQPGAARR